MSKKQNRTDDFQTRAFPLEPKTYSEEEHSVEAVLTTEDPAAVWDWERGIVNEVLLMSGLLGAKSGTILPLLDSHQRGRSDDQIGSTEIREIKDGKIIGLRRFSMANPRAAVIEGMVREGHLRDGSIGYRVDKADWIEEGRNKKIRGRDFAGPLKVVTAWRLLEDSVTPIGADPKAKVRSEAPSAPELVEDIMDEKIKTELVALGLKAEATDEEVILFVRSLAVKPEVPPVVEPVAETKSEIDQVAAERARVAEIKDLGKLAGLRDLAEKLADEGATVESARKALVESAEKSGRFGGAPAAQPQPEKKEMSEDQIASLIKSVVI